MSVITGNKSHQDSIVIHASPQMDIAIEMPRVPPNGKKIDLWSALGSNIEEHVISFLDVRGLIQISKVSRSCKKAAFNNRFWKPLLERRFPGLQIQAALQGNPQLTLRKLYERQIIDLRLQNARAKRQLIIQEVNMNGPIYSRRFTALNGILMVGAIISAIFEAANPTQKTFSIIVSSCSICLSLVGSRYERTTHQELSYLGYKGISLIYGLLIITRGGLVSTDMPITAGFSITNGSILLIKSAVSENFIPNLCTKTSLKLKAFWSGLVNCTKKIFGCRSQRLVAEL